MNNNTVTQNRISANDLKTKGVKLIDNVVTNNGNQEVLVSVRGITKYAILPIDYYNKLREYELDMALHESLRDIKNGKFIEESVAKHINRVKR